LVQLGLDLQYPPPRTRIGLDFHYLRTFMATCGQEMGFRVTQVAMRVGHDPSIAAKHYSGRVSDTDRALAMAVAALIAPRPRADNELRVITNSWAC
jgi:hypothetical protein